MVRLTASHPDVVLSLAIGCGLNRFLSLAKIFVVSVVVEAQELCREQVSVRYIFSIHDMSN